MSNTYFSIKKKDVHLPIDGVIFNSPGYTNEMELNLTAFVAGQGKKGLQITCNIQSTLPNQSGRGYISLDSEEQMRALIGAIEERIKGNISATGDEQLPSLVYGYVDMEPE